MRKQFVETMESLFQINQDLVLLLGDIGVYGFNKAANLYPDRVYNIGILEQTTLGVAAGLSSSGLIPVVHTIAPFMVERALEQIKIDFGYQKIGGNLVSVGASYDYAALGCTHHCPGDVATLLAVPEVQIIVPGTSKEFDALFSQTYDNSVITYHRLSERENINSQRVEIGKAVQLRSGNKDLVIAIGPTLDLVMNAFEGVEVNILYYTTIYPFDAAAIKKCIKHSARILVIEPFYAGTLTNLIQDAVSPLPVAIRTIGVPRKFLRNYGSTAEHDEKCGFTVENIQAIAKEFFYD